MEYKYSLGQTVSVIGFEDNGVVIARSHWESIARPEPQAFYEVRFNDKNQTFSEAEVFPVEVL